MCKFQQIKIILIEIPLPRFEPSNDPEFINVIFLAFQFRIVYFIFNSVICSQMYIKSFYFAVVCLESHKQ